LKDLDIKEHPLYLQNKLFNINQLFLREKNLLNGLIVQKNELQKSIFQKFIG